MKNYQILLNTVMLLFTILTTQAQNVGIGTNTPSERLTINGSVGIPQGQFLVIGQRPAPNTSGVSLGFDGSSFEINMAPFDTEFVINRFNFLSGRQQLMRIVRILEPVTFNVKNYLGLFMPSGSNPRIELDVEGNILARDGSVFVGGITINDEVGGRFHQNGSTIFYDNKGASSGFQHVFRGGGAQGANNLASINHLGQHLAVGYVVVSDQRFKSAIRPLPYGLHTILNLRPAAYSQTLGLEVKDGNIVPHEGHSKSMHSIGLIAQELHALVPEAVMKPTDESNGTWAIDYIKLIPVLIQAMQEQQEMIETQKLEIAELKKQNAAFYEELKQIRAIFGKYL
ncbi:MAG: tail fiber domain-containing protein [Chitinophagaceae bacterium]|jgi:hypothetical protein|nr:tail fiber domain-containing protein [Chitinophagaceae bacterium]